MNTDLLNRLLARDEGQFLEFKSAYERPRGTGFKRRKATDVAWDIAETLSAMANARQHGNTFTNQAYQKVSNVDRDLAYREIQEVIGLGIVGRPLGRYSRTYHVVKPSTPPPIPEELDAILDLLRQQEYIVNKDLREAWGVSRVTAWRRAKALITEGFLRQEGEKRSTRYHPADKLEEILRNT